MTSSKHLLLATALISACLGNEWDPSDGAPGDGATGDGGDADSDVDADADTDTDADTDADADTDTDADADIDADTDADSDADIGLEPGTHSVTVGTAFGDRTLLLHVPSSLSAPAPLLVALHGNGDTAANFMATGGLEGASESAGFLLAVLAAIPGSSPVGGVDWDAYTLPTSANADFAFVMAAVEEVRATGGVDPAAIYLLGYSQGGYLAFYSAMSAADLFAAVHVQSAANPMPGSGLVGGAARRVPVDLLIGALDWNVDGARSTRSELESAGHEVRFEEVAGWGHCCFQSDRVGDIWGWLSARPLP